MPKFNLSVALNVCCYGTIEIEASSKEEALAKVKELVDQNTLWDPTDPDWESCYDHRIVSLYEEGAHMPLLEDLYYGSDEWAKTFD